ncbi:MAG: hypothetical protein AB7E47_15730 [Desulfovibrionaceae bacterium]
MPFRIASQHVALFLLTLILLWGVPVSASGEVKTFNIELCEPVSNNQSQDQVVKFAQQKASREALEQAGTYIISQTQIESGMLTGDEVTAIAAGLVKVDIIESKPDIISGLLHVRVKSLVTVDMDNLENDVQRILKNRDTMDKLKASQARIHELERKLDALVLKQRTQELSSERKLALNGAFEDVYSEIKTLRDNQTKIEVLGESVSHVQVVAPMRGTASSLIAPKPSK